ncbi:MAG: hypothetical protein WCJ11_08235 [Methylococcaceae bacterium]
MKIIAVIAMRHVKSLIFVILLIFVLPIHAKIISQNGSLILTPSHGMGSAWGKSLCQSCHALQRLHETVPKTKAIVDKKKFVTCTGCHGDNGAKKTEPQCLVCHNPQDMPANPMRTGKHRHDFDASKDLPTTSRQCVVCHAASNMNGKFELNIDLTMFNDKPKNTPIFEGGQGGFAYKDQNEFCLRCHNRNHQQTNYPIIHAGRRDQSIAAEDDYRKIDKHGVPEGLGDGIYNGLRDGYSYKTVVDCDDCHTMHGTTNKGLIIDNSRKGAFLLNSKFRSKPYSVKLLENDTNYSQLCALCHNMKTVSDGGEIDTGNGLSGVHFNNGSDCVTCHNHGERVQKGL